MWIRNDLFRIRLRVLDPEYFASDPTPDPYPTFKEVSAPSPDSDTEPTPDPDHVSGPATLVSPSRELRGKLAFYIREITTIYKVF